ncbi:MAG: hypothetical protein IPF62_12305 [Bacteroidetes bacterium]|nr:hypothetical protein [Bacteroidota bacterium]
MLDHWKCIGSNSFTKEIEEQIKQVENNLSGRVILNGKAANIADRSVFYNVKGLSIAL